MRRLRKNTIALFGVGFVFILGVLGSGAEAATFHPDGTVDLEVHFTYPPDQQEIDNLIAQLDRAKMILCDATEGQIRLGKIRIAAAGVQETADIWLLPQTARSFATPSGRIHLYHNDVVGAGIAHELGHTLFGLGDSYDEQRRAGGPCGIGPSFDADVRLDEVWHSIMQSSGAQVCVDQQNLKGRSFYNPADWWDVPCTTDSDCAGICVGTGCPMNMGIPVQWFCPSPPFLFSEFSVAANHDARQGNNQGCPEPKAGQILILNAKLNPFQGAASPFDGSTFETAAATANFWTELEVLDSLGRVTGIGVGQSSHLIRVYFRRAASDQWEVHLLGRDEEYQGGIQGNPKPLATYHLDFNSTTVINTITVNGQPQPASDPVTLVLGSANGTGEFAPGLDSVIAPQVMLDVRMQGITRECWPNFATSGFLCDSRLRGGTGVFAGEPGLPGELQRATCTNEQHCNRAWNSVTLRYEATHHTLAFDPSNVPSDWQRMEARLAAKGITISVPPEPSEAPPSLAVCPPLDMPDVAIQVPDQVMMVMDRSGSMTKETGKAGAGGQTRLAFAKAAARAFVDLQDKQATEIGFITFSHVVVDNLIDMVPVDSTVPTPTGAISPALFKTGIDSVSAHGFTAIGDALKRAGEVLTTTPPANSVKAVLLLTDGENNQSSSCPGFPPGCIKEDPVTQAKALLAAGVAVYTVPTGGSADRGQMAKIAELTGGRMLDAPVGDELPAIYAELYARTRGEAPVLQRTPSSVVSLPRCAHDDVCPVGIPTDTPRGCRCFPPDGSTPELPEVEEFEIPVESEGQRLHVMLSSRNATAAVWNPDFKLKDPNGATVLTDLSPGILTDPLYRILTVAFPAAGTWKLEIAARDTTEQHTYLLAHVENPGPDCFAKATPGVTTDGQSVVISAAASYGAQLGAGVTMTGSVLRPDGSKLSLSFTYDRDPLIGYTATVPASEFRGRGIYDVVVRCSVSSSASFQEGETIFARSIEPGEPEIPAAPNISLVPFVREARAAFFLDSGLLPALPPGGDADNNGIPDASEGDPTLDTDADGLPDIRDEDDDNDDEPDETDPEPKNPGCDGGAVGPPAFVFVPPPVHVSTCPVTNIGQADAAGCGVVVTNDAPASFSPGTTIVTWTATNAHGSVTATQAVTVELGDSPSCCPAGTNVIIGTHGPDVLFGTSGGDCILGLGGDDVIYGNGGSDFISGGEGNDTVDGMFSAAMCYVNGGPGNDVISASPVTGTCTLVGGPGDDVIDGGSGPDRIEGGDGDDVCHGAGGNDLIEAAAGADTCEGGSGDDQIFGGEGDDTLSGGSGTDTIDGGGGVDVCSGEIILSCAP